LSVASTKAGVTRSVTVEQASSYFPFLIVSLHDVAIDAVAGATLVEIATNTTDWTFSIENAPWLTGEKTEEGLKLTATENNLSTGERTAVILVVSVSAGVNESITVRQPSNFKASLIVSETSPFAVTPAGGEASITVVANVSDWTVESSEAWLTAVKTGSGSVRLTFGENTNAPRSAVLSFASAIFPEVNKTLTVTQAVNAYPDDTRPVGYVYFEDDFSWIGTLFANVVDEVEDAAAGGTSVAGSINIYTGALAGSYAAGDMLKAFNERGYNDAIPNAAGDYRIIYFCKNYLKFSKTNYQGGFYRQLTQIDAGKSVNVAFSFDALPVKGGTDNYDDVVLNVIIDGPGSINANDGATKVAVVDISKIPTGTLPYEWRQDRDRQQVILYGITADSKIIIKTNQEDKNPGTGSWYYRYYIDNVKFLKHSTH
jgi:hypothetical protein